MDEIPDPIPPFKNNGVPWLTQAVTETLLKADPKSEIVQRFMNWLEENAEERDLPCPLTFGMPDFAGMLQSRGITRAQFASTIGASELAVETYELGLSMPSVYGLLRMAEDCGFPAATFFWNDAGVEYRRFAVGKILGFPNRPAGRSR